jgi:hypothetical protein
MIKIPKKWDLATLQLVPKLAKELTSAAAPKLAKELTSAVAPKLAKELTSVAVVFLGDPLLAALDLQAKRDPPVRAAVHLVDRLRVLEVSAEKERAKAKETPMQVAPLADPLR